MKKEELIELVNRILMAEGTEDEINEMIFILEQNVPDPYISDLIFHHKPELSAEEIVEKALDYNPIQL